MRRLTVQLAKVEKTAENKIYNTLSFKVKTDNDVENILYMYHGNVAKSYLSNIN